MSGVVWEQLGGALLYLITSQRVYQVSGLAGEVARIKVGRKINAQNVDASLPQVPNERLTTCCVRSRPG